MLTPIIVPRIIITILLINLMVLITFGNDRPIIKLMHMYIVEYTIPFNNPFLFTFIPNITEAIKNNDKDKMLVRMLLVFRLIKSFCFKIVKRREKIKVDNNMKIIEKE